MGSEIAKGRAHSQSGGGAPKRETRTLHTVSWLHLREGRVLFVRARENPVCFLPGGKIEPGEAALDALTRELREELGVELQAALAPPLLVDGPAFGKEGVRLAMRAFRAAVDGEPSPRGEVRELRFVGADEESLCPPVGRRVLDWLVARGEVGASEPVDGAELPRLGEAFATGLAAGRIEEVAALFGPPAGVGDDARLLHADDGAAICRALTAARSMVEGRPWRLDDVRLAGAGCARFRILDAADTRAALLVVARRRGNAWRLTHAHGPLLGPAAEVDEAGPRP